MELTFMIHKKMFFNNWSRCEIFSARCLTVLIMFSELCRCVAGVRVYLSMCVCVHTSVWCVYLCMRVCIHVCECVYYLCTCMHVYSCVCVYLKLMYVCVHVCWCAYVLVCVCTVSCVSVSSSLHVCASVGVWGRLEWPWVWLCVGWSINVPGWINTFSWTNIW